MTGVVLEIARFRSLVRVVPPNERRAAIREVVALETIYQAADEAAKLEIMARRLVRRAIKEAAK